MSDQVGMTLDIGSMAGAGEAATAAAPKIRANAFHGGYYWGTGRRKRAGARVRIRSGEGKIVVNGRDLDVFFKLEKDRSAVMGPLMATDSARKVDVFVNVNGGGITGQSGAIVMGLARALEAMDPSFSHALHVGQFMTRDGRMTERKKYGQRGARRRFQFSKH